MILLCSWGGNEEEEGWRCIVVWRGGRYAYACLFLGGGEEYSSEEVRRRSEEGEETTSGSGGTTRGNLTNLPLLTYYYSIYDHITT